MKKQFIPLISLFLFIVKANGQSGLPPVYDIINDTALHTEFLQDIGKMLKKDKKGKLTIQQVIQSPVADEFHLINRGTTSLLTSQPTHIGFAIG